MLQEIKRSAIKGAAFAAGATLFAALSYVVADSLHTFSSGQVISASNINANFNKLPPVGGIIAWHKNMAGVSTALPDGWLECNGQVVSDSESTLNGQTLPNLNSPRNAWNLRGSFLRGHSVSGLFENDYIQGHFHGMSGVPQATGDIMSPTGPPTAVWMGTTARSTGDPTTGNNGMVRFDDETKPVNMSVVWIIRIK